MLDETARLAGDEVGDDESALLGQVQDLGKPGDGIRGPAGGFEDDIAVPADGAKNLVSVATGKRGDCGVYAPEM
jgi:hypothetical protein